VSAIEAALRVVGEQQGVGVALNAAQPDLV
jgi:hypothetical protein